MITPLRIKEKTQRLYPKFVQSWLAGEHFFPRRLPVDLKLPKDLGAAKQAVSLLRTAAKQAHGSGYTIEWESRRSRSHGLNQFPAAIIIEMRDDLLFLADATKQFTILEGAVATLRSHCPDLENWLQQPTNWKTLLTAAIQLNDLFLMTQYRLDNPFPDCFAREIPLPVSTKLIEENKQLLSAWLDLLRPHNEIDFRFGRDEFERRYGLRHVRHHVLVRLLGPELQKRLGLRFPELSLPVDSIKRLQPEGPNVFVVENKINLLTLSSVRNGIALGGLGKAVSLLREINWLQNAPIYYWGDLDVEGFEILSQFRLMFQQTDSLLMNMDTLQTYTELAIPWQNRNRGTPSGLTKSEHATYECLLHNCIRLEQERIPQSAVFGELRRLGVLEATS